MIDEIDSFVIGSFYRSKGNLIMVSFNMGIDEGTFAFSAMFPGRIDTGYYNPTILRMGLFLFQYYELSVSGQELAELIKLILEQSEFINENNLGLISSINGKLYVSFTNDKNDPEFDTIDCD